MLIDDPWINEGYDHSPISTDVSQRVDEDDAIIALMERKYKIDRESIIKGLRENVYDETTAIYYLLYYEKDMRAQLVIEVAGMPAAVSLPSPAPTITQMESPISPTHGRESSAMGSKPLMMRIDEDGVLPSPAQPPIVVAPPGGETLGQGAAQSRKPVVQTKPRKRRFTVGGEADMAKFADEDEEAAENLKKLQNKEEGHQPSVGVPLPVRAVGGEAPPLPAIVGSNQKMSPENSAGQIGSAAAANNIAPTSPEAGDRPQRKRHNTIVGILRNQLRRQSETTMSPIYPTADRGTDTVGASGVSGNMPTIASNSGAAITHEAISSTSPLPHGAEDEPVKTEDNKPRSLRFTFNSNTTSGKPPDDIISEVAAACDSHGIGHRLASRFLIECFCQPGGAAKDALKFEIEVCKLPRLKNLHGLRFKRVAGSSADYKYVCEKILGTVML